MLNIFLFTLSFRSSFHILFFQYFNFVYLSIYFIFLHFLVCFTIFYIDKYNLAFSMFCLWYVIIFYFLFVDGLQPHTFSPESREKGKSLGTSWNDFFLTIRRIIVGMIIVNTKHRFNLSLTVVFLSKRQTGLI